MQGRFIPCSQQTLLSPTGLKGVRCLTRHHAVGHDMFGSFLQTHGTELVNGLHFAYESVTLPCSSVICGDMIYRRCSEHLLKGRPAS